MINKTKEEAPLKIHQVALEQAGCFIPDIREQRDEVILQAGNSFETCIKEGLKQYRSLRAQGKVRKLRWVYTRFCIRGFLAAPYCTRMDFYDERILFFSILLNIYVQNQMLWFAKSRPAL